MNTNKSKSDLSSQPANSRPLTPSAYSVPFEYLICSKKELADYLGVEERTIENWMSRRYLPYFKIGGTVRFKVCDVLRHLETHHQVKPRQHAFERRQALAPR